MLYIKAAKIGEVSSSNIKSKSHNKAIFITMVKSPRVIISNGRDSVFKIGFKK